jgi:hypothetical protein
MRAFASAAFTWESCYAMRPDVADTSAENNILGHCCLLMLADPAACVPVCRCCCGVALCSRAEPRSRSAQPGADTMRNIRPDSFMTMQIALARESCCTTAKHTEQSILVSAAWQ